MVLPPIPVDGVHSHLPYEEGFFHTSLLPMWFFCWESHTMPVDSTVVNTDWWISVTPSSMAWYTSLLSVPYPSYAPSVLSQISSQSHICIPWGNLYIEWSKLCLQSPGLTFCPLDEPEADGGSCVVLLQWLSHVF